MRLKATMWWPPLGAAGTVTEMTKSGPLTGRLVKDPPFEVSHRISTGPEGNDFPVTVVVLPAGPDAGLSATDGDVAGMPVSGGKQAHAQLTANTKGTTRAVPSTPSHRQGLLRCPDTIADAITVGRSVML